MLRFAIAVVHRASPIMLTDRDLPGILEANAQESK
jgi:hypothetical protein